MNAFFFVLTVLGTVASITSLFIAAPGKRSKLMHLAYAVCFTLLSGALFHYQQASESGERRMKEMLDIQGQAKSILATVDRSSSGSASGFMLASLAFLEKHKDVLPDTYSRAWKLCESSGCVESGYAGMPIRCNTFIVWKKRLRQ